MGGIVDAIDAGSPEQAKAMALLGIASLDQASIDGRNWLLAAEYSLESAPPYSSFQRPRALDPLEAKQTKLLDQRWVSVFMSRLKERDSFTPQSAAMRRAAGRGIRMVSKDSRTPLEGRLANRKGREKGRATRRKPESFSRLRNW